MSMNGMLLHYICTNAAQRGGGRVQALLLQADVKDIKC